jgi:hypothetical protein
MVDMTDKIIITIDSKYHRSQFDDWLAGGKVEYNERTYYWSAQNSNYGLGWEIQPISEEDWENISESQFNKIIGLIEVCLNKHLSEYNFIL